MIIRKKTVYGKSIRGRVLDVIKLDKCKYADGWNEVVLIVTNE